VQSLLSCPSADVPWLAAPCAASSLEMLTARAARRTRALEFREEVWEHDVREMHRHQTEMFSGGLLAPH